MGNKGSKKKGKDKKGDKAPPETTTLPTTKADSTKAATTNETLVKTASKGEPAKQSGSGAKSDDKKSKESGKSDTKDVVEIQSDVVDEMIRSLYIGDKKVLPSLSSLVLCPYHFVTLLMLIFVCEREPFDMAAL